MSNATVADLATPVVSPRTPEPDWGSASLLGGPLHKFGHRLGLIRGTNSVRFGVAIGAFFWLILFLVAVATGNGDRAFNLASVATHLRLLVVIPLMFVCETWLDPQVSSFVRTSVESGLIPKSEYPHFERLLRRLTRLRNSPWPDALSAIAAAPLIGVGTSVFEVGAASTLAAMHHQMLLSVALIANVTVFRFLVFRWVWRLSLWWWFLWRVSRLKLHLVASHPDRAGGLGQLEVVQFQFLPLIAAASVLLSSTHAEALARGLVPVTIIYAAAGYAVVIGVMIVVVPLLVFSGDLMRCREREFAEYTALAMRYVTAFHEKWIVRKTEGDLLGSADIQSLADLSNGVNIVREMRVIPVSARLILQVVVVAFIPMLPLSLFKQSMTELLQHILVRLLGG